MTKSSSGICSVTVTRGCAGVSTTGSSRVRKSTRTPVSGRAPSGTNSKNIGSIDDIDVEGVLGIALDHRRLGEDRHEVRVDRGDRRGIEDGDARRPVASTR